MNNLLDEQQNRSIASELDSLYRKAKTGAITLDGFFSELENLGITGLSQAMHASKAFGISLNETKTAFIERLPGGMDSWLAQFEDTDSEDLNDQ